MMTCDKEGVGPCIYAFRRTQHATSDPCIIVAAALIFMVFAGCSANIGDSCDDNVDCSPDGDRICDLSQPGGYCTVPDCQPGSCPGEAVCVMFWEGAHTRTWCLLECSSDGACRGDYYCAPGRSEVSEIIDDVDEDTGYCIESLEETEDAGEDEEV